MNRNGIRFLWLSLAALLSLFLMNLPAMAGPPLICHPFEIGNARSLPWGGTDWRAVKHDYEINHLVGDTLALLRPETTVIVRMETIRRATVYSVWGMRDSKVGYPTKDLSVAAELLSKL